MTKRARPQPFAWHRHPRIRPAPTGADRVPAACDGFTDEELDFVGSTSCTGNKGPMDSGA